MARTTRPTWPPAGPSASARALEEKYAREVMQITYDSSSGESLSELGMVDAQTLAAWNRDNGQTLTTAERAEADRSWAYGHVILDEAQELSAMAWRMVLRRNPARSMTVVGDVAQTGSPAGATSWKDMLVPLVGGRWREERLTVNYRTPSEIMTVAADVLASVSPDGAAAGLGPLRGRAAVGGRVPDGGPSAGVADRATADLAAMGGPDGGRLAIVAPDALIGALAAAVPAAVTGDRPESLDSVAALLTVAQAKGLEFDRVIVADPAGILAASPTGRTTCTWRSPGRPTA